MPTGRDTIVIGVGSACTLGLLWAFRSDLLPGLIVAAVAGVSTWLAVIDFAEHRLPNRIIVPLAGFTSAAVLVLGVVDDNMRQALEAILTGLGVFVVLFLCGLIGGIGMGDVKFSYSLTTLLAWFGSISLQTAVLVMFLTAAIYTFGALIRNRTFKMQIPFGPFMALGFVAGALVAAT